MDLSNPMIMQLVQQRLANLVGRNSGFVKSLPPRVQNRVHTLRKSEICFAIAPTRSSVHDDYSVIQRDLNRELRKLQVDFEKQTAPILALRRDIVVGAAEPEPGLVTTGTPSGLALDEGEDSDMPGVPGFWLDAMKQIADLADRIEPADEPALAHLIDVRASTLDDPELMGFRLEFEFSPNPFFANTILTKTYIMSPEEEDDDDEPSFDHATGTDIEWKTGQSLTHKKTTKTQRRKGSKQTRTVTKTTLLPSFFHFFSPPEPPTEDDEGEEDDEEDKEELMEKDFEAGQAVRDRLVPRATAYFTGELIDSDDDEGDDEDDEDGHRRTRDDDDDDDDDAPPALEAVEGTGAGLFGGAPPAGGLFGGTAAQPPPGGLFGAPKEGEGEKPEECKTQ